MDACVHVWTRNDKSEHHVFHRMQTLLGHNQISELGLCSGIGYLAWNEVLAVGDRRRIISYLRGQTDGKPSC
jgi:hypothetical protein